MYDEKGAVEMCERMSAGQCSVVCSVVCDGRF